MPRASSEQALADAAQAIRLDPKCVPSYHGRGIAYYEARGELDRAIADYE